MVSCKMVSTSTWDLEKVIYRSGLSPTTDSSVTACALCNILEVTRRVQHLIQQVSIEEKPATIS